MTENQSELMNSFNEAIKNFPYSTSDEALNKSVRFAKQTHIALNDPHWKWAGSTGFSDVWCWLPTFKVEYADIKDYLFNASVGFESSGQKTNFFVRISSLDINDPNWFYAVDLDVAELISIDDLIESAGKAAYELLKKNLPEIDRKKMERLRKKTNRMYLLDFGAWKGTTGSEEYFPPELYFSRSSAIERFKERKRSWIEEGKQPRGCSLLAPNDDIEYLT